MVDSIVTTSMKKFYLQKQPCFSKLTDNEASELATLLVEKTFKEGEIIVTQGDHVDSIYLIITGTADVQVSTVENGKIVTQSVATLGPEKAIGLSETGFYSLSGLRTATVSAITPMETLRLSVAAFNGFVLANHHVKEAMRSFSGAQIERN